METGNLTTIETIAPDAELTVSRTHDLPGPAGAPGTITETGRLARYGRIVILTLPAVADVLTGDIRTSIEPDEHRAAVTYGNLAEELRRDGWTLRHP
jgi:hypothetical protein